MLDPSPSPYASLVEIIEVFRHFFAGHPARFQEAGEVAALAQLGDAQLDRAGTGFQSRSR
jgi:hypothetical protein